MALSNRSSWNEAIPSFTDGRLQTVLEKVNALRSKEIVYPPEKDVFRAFDLTTFDSVKVVITGQDPYHGDGQAHGLAFSVPEGIPAPPSLRNILKERKEEGYPERSTDLSDWARQGVLLLNTVLTVTKAKAGSHASLGWQEVTGEVLSVLNARNAPIVFLLWGRPAQRLGSVIDTSHHAIIEAPHPSPLSAYRGFFGSRPFSRTNEILSTWGVPQIEW